MIGSSNSLFIGKSLMLG